MARNQRYGKKRNRNRKKPVKSTAMYKIAKKANYDMIPKKYHLYDGTVSLNDYQAPPGVLIMPTEIPSNQYVGNQGTGDLSKRNTNNIYLERTSGVFNIRPFPTMVNPLHVRKVCGWWKGVSTTTADGPHTNDSLSATSLHSTFSDRLARYDPANYKILEDKFFTIVPHSIYDQNGSDNANLSEPMRAIWKPTLVKCNFACHRRFTYADGKQSGQDDEIDVSGSQVMGWKPFIFLQVFSPDQQYTPTEKVDIDYKFTSYFKDVQ